VNGQRGSSRIAISHFPDRYVPNHSAKKALTEISAFF
jgi:hypothetical protein